MAEERIPSFGWNDNHLRIGKSANSVLYPAIVFSFGLTISLASVTS
jgi:hypothetical protein